MHERAYMHSMIIEVTESKDATTRA